jgi:hypothetical protein
MRIYGPLGAAATRAEVQRRWVPNPDQWLHFRPGEGSRANMKDLDGCMLDAQHTNGLTALRASTEIKGINRIK